MDAEILHRIQFGFTLTFHYFYPPLSIGLSLALIIFEALYLKTGNPLWEKITQFWIRVFALTFALGVASGIPLMFSFGTNWARFSQFVGDVLGSALAAEGLFAFGIEAGALGLMLFGWKKVSHRAHFFAVCSVSFGAHFSGVWITCVNSWMQTPAGYIIAKNAKNHEVAIVTNWMDMVFNPSALSHLIHVILGAWLTGAFLIISVSSYYLIKKRYREFAVKSMQIGLAIASLAILAQLVSADHLARLIAKYNPVKFAAFEGLYKTEPYSKLYACGVVDEQQQTVYGIGVPGLLSFLVHRDLEKPVAGLDQVDKNQWPWVAAVFQAYHTMVAMWVMMFAGCLAGVWMWWKNRWAQHPWLLKFLVVAVVFPQVANIAGWYSTCLGRQPWTVYQLLKTKDAYSKGVSCAEAATTLTMFVIVYVSLLVLFLFLLDRKIKHGPTDLPEEAPYRDIYKQH
jgi:cytochrome d ubiquinol oxidase subunit I